MWDLLSEVQQRFPSTEGTSFLSFRSKSLFFTCWSVGLGGLSTVFGDPGYSQRAIASDTTAVFAGYIMGGICWFIVPWALGSSIGLASRALLTNPNFVTYPNELSSFETNAGMPLIYALNTIFGKSGAAAGLVMIFMSVTSATSAELIAFSSIFSYDIYKNYINSKSTGEQIVKVAHWSVVFFTLLSSGLAVVFNYVGVSTGWIISFYGIILGPEVSALVLSLYWKKFSTIAIVGGCILGTISGIVCWIGGTYHWSGGLVNKDTLMIPEATFVGNIASIFSSLIYFIIISALKPADFNFDIFMNSFEAGDDALEREIEAMHIDEKQRKSLRNRSYASILLNAFFLIGVAVVLPLSFYAAKSAFSKRFFTLWIAFMMAWLLIAASYLVIMPLWQGRFEIILCMKQFIRGQSQSIVDEDNSTHDKGRNEKLSDIEINISNI
ncbi:uncharacterized protein PRCAT00004033001 [Priceomyces carsonii]|uniref:uncharacterized protein n=1 Tax=Priceomyces carsonii TaxID=28549 RepID=UPI002ED9859D|nr:unnamed protein product [Priceomyces carsonii]